ncbi:LLM class flavin-dependent oxidoreductase [Streptomyces sp. NPDC041068]|uniref:LLM class flavin-dependent oxidoreductase n=1 Tax=Streptomyces sp. NPDC041068 TaxID=3155130 RepID=UPI0033F4E837
MTVAILEALEFAIRPRTVPCTRSHRRGPRASTRGWDGATAYFADALTYLDQAKFDFEELLPSGDRVTAFGWWSGRFKETGNEFNVRFVHFWHIQDGKVGRAEGTVKRETPWPGGGELGRDFYRTLDPVVSLIAAAMVTERLILGGGVFQVTQRDLIALAKEIASLDLMSGGRVVVGVGAGWNREEVRNHGTAPRMRMSVLREHVLAMKALWTREEAEFHGDFVSFDPVLSWPEPVQRPHPTIMVGGNPSGRRRAGPGLRRRLGAHLAADDAGGRDRPREPGRRLPATRRGEGP